MSKPDSVSLRSHHGLSPASPHSARIRSLFFLIVLCVLSAAVASRAGGPSREEAQPLRPLTPSDFQRLERRSKESISLDGQWVSYVLTRSAASRVSPDHDALYANQRSEVWVASLAGGAAKRVAGGADQTVGFWSAVWSPDSRKLALESATLDGQAGLWVWERETGKLRKLIEHGLFAQSWAPLKWNSENEILFSLTPDDEAQYDITGFRGTTERAKAAWAKGFAGREPSVSVLESGIPQAQPQNRLMVIDVRNEQQHQVLGNTCTEVAPSPSAAYVACERWLDQTVISTGGALREGPPFLFDAAVASPDGHVFSGTEGAKDEVPFSLRWSPDGSQVAWMGRARLAADSPLTAFVYRPDQGTLAAMNMRGIVLIANYYGKRPKMFWTAHGELIVYAQPDSLTETRPDWWVLSEKEAPRNATKGMKSAPSALLPERGGESFLGVAQGKLWRIRPSGSEAQELSGELPAKLTSIFWPNYARFDSIVPSAQISTLVLSTQRTTLSGNRDAPGAANPGTKGVEADFFLYDIASGKFTNLKPPSSGATFLAFSPQLGAALFDVSDRTGTYLWETRPSSEPRLLMQTNTFFREISETKWKMIQYRGSDGQDLIGWVMLPVGYEEGKHYPMVTRLYAGEVYSTAPPTENIIDASGEGEAPLLAAHGYAVLFPSMPRAPYGTASDNYADLTKGVLPAVDRAVDLGIADPHRLGLIGQSYGGFSVYGLITQTKRFQAAVALAGLSDFINDYGQLNGGTRYGASPYPGALSQASMAERGQIALGTPPWKDVEHYVRNSPIFYADHVETPILIIQGDMDYVPIQQGEEFFTAMYRQQKRARFLRYWTSGHVIADSANALDMWKQIYAWFDEFLKPGPSVGKTADPAAPPSPPN